MLDTNNTSQHDIRVIIPAILIAITIILMVFVTPIVAPIYITVIYYVVIWSNTGRVCTCIQSPMALYGFRASHNIVLVCVPGGARHRLQYIPHDSRT